jgi:hypothetical protein
VLHGIRQKLSFLRGGVQRLPCGRSFPPRSPPCHSRPRGQSHTAQVTWRETWTPSWIPPCRGFWPPASPGACLRLPSQWLCHTLRALLQAVTADVARDPAEIILPDATDLPDGVGPPRQRPDPMWLQLAANALKVCNPSGRDLQGLVGSPMWRARPTSCRAASRNLLRGPLAH